MNIRKTIKSISERDHLKNYLSLVLSNKLTSQEMEILLDVLVSKDRDIKSFVKRYAAETKNSASYIRIYLYKLRDKGLLALENKFVFAKNLIPPKELKIEFILKHEERDNK
jgi:hypothetical protein